MLVVVAIHASSAEVVRLIAEGKFSPGRGLGCFLGPGGYFYIICGEGGFDYARDSAASVARRKYRGPIDWLIVEVCIDNGLHLQHPLIARAVHRFCEAFEKRLGDLPLCLEPNDQSGLSRPRSGLSIEAFRYVVEVLSGREIHALAARFPETNSLVDVIFPPELCIKLESAIRSIRVLKSEDRASRKMAQDPQNWPCDERWIKAAEAADDLVLNLDVRALVDLVIKAQGAISDWSGRAPRFPADREVRYVYDSSDSVDWRETKRVVEYLAARHGRRVGVYDVAQGTRTLIQALDVRRQVLDDPGGLILHLGPRSGEVLSCLLGVVDAARTPPSLVLLDKGAKAPLLARAWHNVTLVDAEKAREVGQMSMVFEGFLRDMWSDTVGVAPMAKALAARCRVNESEVADAAEIMAAYRTSRCNGARLLDATAESRFGDLPPDPVEAAEVVLAKAPRDRFRTNLDELIQLWGDCERLDADIRGAGYLVPKNWLGDTHVIVVSTQTRSLARRRFTIAHELGHLALQGIGLNLGPEAEERWCDDFATALLMPRRQVALFAANVTDLVGWMTFHDAFGVSLTAAAIYLWEHFGIALTSQDGLKASMGRSEGLFDDLRTLGAAAVRKGDTRGDLPFGGHYVVRRTSSKSFLVVAQPKTAGP